MSHQVWKFETLFPSWQGQVRNWKIGSDTRFLSVWCSAINE